MTKEELLEKVGKLVSQYEGEYDNTILAVEVMFLDDKESFCWNGERFTPTKFETREI